LPSLLYTLNSYKHSSQTQMASINTLIPREFSIDAPSASSLDSVPAASGASKRVQSAVYREPKKKRISRELRRHDTDSLVALIAEDKASPRAALSEDEQVEEWGREKNSNGTPVFSNETSAPESWVSQAFDSLLDRSVPPWHLARACVRARVCVCVCVCVCVFTCTRD